jgi:hypothetical protein
VTTWPRDELERIGDAEELHIQRFLSANCFGDYWDGADLFCHGVVQRQAGHEVTIIVLLEQLREGGCRECILRA